ncbi:MULTISPECIES: hypothetical protein [unclassified Sphingomonas]|uniref:hypothetical protein n=1 Tax=unclassified Sphingomonas TaxID=196159 RepID=UPI0010F78AE3|nr:MULTISPECIES: hypothetical protein [unclassified Sphingomonas]
MPGDILPLLPAAEWRMPRSALRMQPEVPALSAFDGDCTEVQINGWLREERAERELNPDWLVLPADGLTPEKWIVRELAGEAYRNALSRELNCTPAIAASHVEAMRVQLDHHDCGYILGERTGIPHDTARRMIARSVARSHPGLDPLRTRIAQILDGAP